MSPSDVPSRSRGDDQRLPDAPAAPIRLPTPNLTRWQKFRVVVRVVELRLRFVVLMAATGLVFGYWDTIGNYYEKYTRPHGEAAVSAPGGFEHYCPMHPTVVQSEPGSCPVCGMPLAKRKKGVAEALPPGVLARVALAPLRVAQAGIRTVAVGYAPLSETVTTVGSVVFDERRLARISSRTKGMSRVETLAVNFTGVAVKAGEPLAELYSPELFQAIRELLLAQRTARPQTASGRALLGDGGELVSLAREKLALWGITPKQVDEILARGKADYRVPILSPISGVVVRKNVVAGQYVSEGEAMFEVADLSRVWIQAQVFEHQIGLVSVGQAVEATVETYPGQVFKGVVAFKDPVLNPSTRTLSVRYDLENSDGRLRPGMFATVTLTTPLADTPGFRDRLAGARPGGGAPRTAAEQRVCPVTTLKLGSMGDPVAVDVEGTKVWACCAGCLPKLKAAPAKYLARLVPPPRGAVLSVPESAVVDTGARKLVYVESEPGVFEGREVVLGPPSGDRYPVLDGLSPGETVASSGAFLIDAETRLNPPSPGDAAPPPPATKPKPQTKDTIPPPRSASTPTRNQRY
jgi:Cu(I)/Ag(I) efflux system membrane fusion protein